MCIRDRLRTRDGSILKQADGKSSVQNSLWREKLYTITDMLTCLLYTSREPPKGEAGAPKISEFPGAVKGGGVVIDVTMDVMAVCMRGNDKSVPPLRPAHSQLIADTVRLLRCDLDVYKRQGQGRTTFEAK